MLGAFCVDKSLYFLTPTTTGKVKFLHEPKNQIIKTNQKKLDFTMWCKLNIQRCFSYTKPQWQLKHNEAKNPLHRECTIRGPGPFTTLLKHLPFFILASV